VGSAATKLFEEAKHLLAKLSLRPELCARAVLGFYEAYSSDESIVLPKANISLEMLRQQRDLGQKNFFCLSDFIAPKGVSDYIGAFAVGMSEEFDKYADYLANEKQNDYESIMIKALADRLAEACAEYIHAQVRTDYWGYAAAEKMSPQDLIAEKYIGIRPAPGYAACPDHTEKVKLFHLLQVEKSIGISLTESMAMTPGSSVCGWYFAHPESKYFNVGKIDRDQLLNYASRKNFTEDEAQVWLRSLIF
jgi:5-methyltetrahydrofolate--homocysteine methyltransferase